MVIVGHSLGGRIALLYAFKYPEDLRGIVSVGSGVRLRVHPMYLDDKIPGTKAAIIQGGTHMVLAESKQRHGGVLGRALA